MPFSPSTDQKRKLPLADHLAWLERPVAHRGLHNRAAGTIENSASAMKAAIAHGLAVEVDLRAAADDVPMVFHDAMLERLTPERGPLASRTSTALRSIYYRESEDRLLSLVDLLQLVKGQVPLVIEIKSKWDGGETFEANIAKALDAYVGPVAIMSFDPRVVARFRTLAPQIPRGLIAESFRNEHWSALSAWRRFAMRNLLYAFSVRPDFIAYDIRSLPAPAPAIARRLFGLPLLTWTVRTEAERARAAQCADAMIFEGFLPGPNG